MAFLAIIGLSLLGVFGDFLIKRAGSGPKYLDLPWFIAGMIAYAVTAFGWFLVMKHMKLSVIGVVYAISVVVGLTMVGLLFYRERLSPVELLGLGLGIASIILLARFAQAP